MQNPPKSENQAQNSLKIDSDWHMRDPETGEIFYLEKGILYSKFPSKESEKLFELAAEPQSESERKVKHAKFGGKKLGQIISNTAKFSSSYKGNKIVLYGGGAIASTFQNDEAYFKESYCVITNIVHSGIVWLEFICPISSQNLYFGLVSQKELTEESFNSGNFKNFKSTTSRRIIMEINYEHNYASFYVNGELNKVSDSVKFDENSKFPCVILKKKSASVIVNPLVRYNFSQINLSYFRNKTG